MALTLDGTNGIVSSGSITTQSASGVIFSDSSALTAASSPFVLKNRIINGDMRIDQRNAGASITPTDLQYSVDRWKCSVSAASKYSVQQNAASVTPPVGFNNYLGVTSLSAYTISSSDTFGIYQTIEGYNVADLAWGTANAKTVTLSFWVRSSLTGTFGLCIVNGYASTYSYPVTYTISAANTWEQKTITITGPTAGSWNATTGTGMSIYFGLGVGSTYSGTSGSWAASQYYGATGSTSVVGTNGATFYITGVQLEIGTSATPFERRMYGQELALCQRYYQKWAYESANKFVSGLGSAPITSEVDFCFPLGISMRSTPTMSYSGLGITDGASGNTTPSSITTYQASSTVAGMYFNGTGFTAFRPYYLRTSASTGYLDASAEL